MYDESAAGDAVFSFDELCDLLVEQGLQSSPSELHGCLCGLLASGASSQAELGLDALCRTLDLALHGELAEQAMRLYVVTAAALEDEEFDFHPLLPDDAIGIAQRTEALARWCSGFLAGFACDVGRGETSAGDLSPDSGEILTDFAALAEAEVDEEASEEESEASYAELVEYLRFAALNVYMDSRARLGDGDLSPGQDQPVH